MTERIRAMKKEGHSYDTISNTLGVSRQYALNKVHGNSAHARSKKNRNKVIRERAYQIINDNPGIVLKELTYMLDCKSGARRGTIHYQRVAQILKNDERIVRETKRIGGQNRVAYYMKE